jgi:hypothetical protein
VATGHGSADRGPDYGDEGWQEPEPWAVVSRDEWHELQARLGQFEQAAS